MFRKINYIFVILAFLSLSIIMSDYVVGHMGESPCNLSTCPICAAHQSTLHTLSILAGILFIGLLHVIGYIKFISWFSFDSAFLLIPSRRAPPIALITR